MSFVDGDRFLRRVDPHNQIKIVKDPSTGEATAVLTSALFKFPRPVKLAADRSRSSVDQGNGDDGIARARDRLVRDFPRGRLAAFLHIAAMSSGFVDELEPDAEPDNPDHCRLDHHDSREAFAALARMCQLISDPPS